MGRDSSSDLSPAPSDIPDESTEATTVHEVEAVKVTTARGKKRAAEGVAISAKRLKRSSRASAPVYKEDEEAEVAGEAAQTTPKNSGRKSKATTGALVAVKVEEAGQETAPSVHTPKKPKRKPKATASVEKQVESKKEEDGTVTQKVKRKRKTKEEKEAEAMPLAARTRGSKVVIGAHISAAGGVHNAVTNSVHIGANAFALFLKSQRKWANPPLSSEHTTSFLSACTTHSYTHKHIVPHGSYLVNLAHTDPDRATQAYDTFIDDLDRCHKLKIGLYNFHPGNCAASSRAEGIAQLAKQLNKSHTDNRSGTVVTLLETMAAGDEGNTLGGTFEDLAATIKQIDAKDRVGVCLDTCHVFAAGYDLRTPESFTFVLDKFDSVIGLKYLKALHVNDSKAPLNSRRDLHANIGTGFLGLRAFHNLVNEPRLWGLPMVLETPIDAPDPDKPGKEIQDQTIWAKEIKMLESLVGMDVESEGFREMEERLARQGAKERDRIQDQVKRREEKKTGKKVKGKSTGKKKGKKAEMSEAEAESSLSELSE